MENKIALEIIEHFQRNYTDRLLKQLKEYVDNDNLDNVLTSNNNIDDSLLNSIDKESYSFVKLLYSWMCDDEEIKSALMYPECYNKIDYADIIDKVRKYEIQMKGGN